jgi:uroporphyrinogen decarboxylase
MTGRERVAKSMRRQTVDRVPWVPFVGCHGGALLGVTAQDYLQSEDLIFRGVSKAVELYKPDGIPVMFDLQIEAEAMGCPIVWAKENPPAVTEHVISPQRPLESLSIPSASAGRIGLALGAARRLRQEHPDIALYGLVTGPFTLALHLLGTSIFTMLFDEPAYVARLMDFCRDVCRAMARYYIEAGCDVIGVVDPMTSQIGPDQFRQFITPAATGVFDSIRAAGVLGSFFVCGHALQNIIPMCECKPDNISVDENIPLFLIRDTCLDMGVSLGGNLQLTTVLLLGKPADAQRNAMECLELAGEQGFLLAPGCDLPYATPPANLQAVAEIVHDRYKRGLARAADACPSPQDMLDLHAYGQADKVIVDIITLDSEACAPCQYMVEAVKQITPEFDGLVEWREHKIKHLESLVFMSSLMVRNIPTICIDGEIKFVSQIPRREELEAAIRRRIYEKLRIRIQRKRSAVFVLGAASETSEQVKRQLTRAIKELGQDLDLSVQEITDEKEIRSFGVRPDQTPAVVVARYQIKSTKDVPPVAIAKEWLKDLTD